MEVSCRNLIRSKADAKPSVRIACNIDVCSSSDRSDCPSSNPVVKEVLHTSAMATSPTMMEDQGRLLEEALGVVRQQAQQMRRCLETPGKLMDALKCA